MWILWARRATTPWQAISLRCRGVAPRARPTVTPGQILDAVRRLGLPPAHIQTQPTDATLVNLDTIFYTR
ncbi:MAG: hypothetical protein ACRDP1_10285, partial [Nocardioidaceae bacterium]